MGKAESERNYQFTEVSKLNAQLEALEAQRDKLRDNIAILTTDISELNDSLSKTTTLRAEEKPENMDVLTKAKEGLDAVSEAIGVLEDFYKGAAKAGRSGYKSGVLSLVSGVDDDAPETASGAYQGNQGAATGILGTLGVIKSDFQRTIKMTKQAEFDSVRELPISRRRPRHPRSRRRPRRASARGTSARPWRPSPITWRTWRRTKSC